MRNTQINWTITFEISKLADTVYETWTQAIWENNHHIFIDLYGCVFMQSFIWTYDMRWIRSRYHITNEWTRVFNSYFQQFILSRALINWKPILAGCISIEVWSSRIASCNAKVFCACLFGFVIRNFREAKADPIWWWICFSAWTWKCWAELGQLK